MDPGIALGFEHMLPAMESVPKGLAAGLDEVFQ
jgi:hypothetical protein